MLIYHLAMRAEWEAAAVGRLPYERSTLGRSVPEVGFVHCSLANQVQRVADFVYQGRSDVVLLTVDTDRVGAEVRMENPEDGDELFPHVYGPLPLEAVVRVEPVPMLDDGTLEVTGLLPVAGSGG